MPDEEVQVYTYDAENERGTLGEYTRRLYDWYINNYLFFSGELKVLGHPDYRIGSRLLYENVYDGVNWEFYIESVEHNFTLTEGYTTTLGVTRGVRVQDRFDFGIRFDPPAGEAEEFEGGYLGEVSIAQLREAEKNRARSEAESGGTGSADVGTGIGGRFASGGLTPWVTKVGQYIVDNFATPEVGGYRQGDPQDHGKGLALDVMTDKYGSYTAKGKALGDEIVAWLMANHKELNISYIIWEQKIWGRGGGSGLNWKVMGDRGSVTQNHYDHVHISFYRGSGQAKVLE